MASARDDGRPSGGGRLDGVRGPRFGAAFWVNRTTWPELRDAALAAEAAGWDSIWLDDHLLCDEGDDVDPRLEGWTALAALAAVTSRAGWATSSPPSRSVTSGSSPRWRPRSTTSRAGRFVLGLGGGWHAREHEAFGIPFGAGIGERLDRLDEAAGLLRRLLDGEVVTHHGRFYDLDGAVCAPRPRPGAAAAPRGRHRAHEDAAHGGPRRRRLERLRVARRSSRELEAVLAAHGAAVGRDVRADRAPGLRQRRGPAAAAPPRAAWDEVVGRTTPSPGRLRSTRRQPRRGRGGARPWLDAGVDEVVLVLRTPFDARDDRRPARDPRAAPQNGSGMKVWSSIGGRT